ncbi:MAG: hypothetical protein RLZZ141_406 [Pseudomonadota bacterium]
MRFSAVTLIWALGFAGVCDVGRSSAATSAPLMAVGVNRVVNIRLWGSASTVVVGNPAIADVNLVNGRSLIITGHSVGQTSIMVLDSGGREIFNQTIVVGAGDAGQVAVQRGGDVTDYSCSPRCEPLIGTDRTANSAQSPAPLDPAP